MNQKEKILIIDDDKSICRSLKLIFNKKGYETETAKTAQEALEKAHKTSFNIALIDIKLPDMEGTVLLGKLKKVYPKMACIIITGHASLQNAMMTIKMGANGYFTKPLLIEDVIYRIKETLSKQQLEKELRESEEKYWNLYELNKDGIAFLDMKGHLLDANQAFLDMLGYRIEEIKGLTYQMLTPKRFHEVDKDIIKNQVKARGYSDEYEKEYIKKEGTVFPITVRAWLIKDKQGKPIGMWVMIRDITERKKAEKALIESEEKHRTVFESTASATVIVEEDTTISMANTQFEKLSGYSKDEIENKKKWTEFVVKEDLERLKKYHVARRKAGGKAPTEYEFRFIDKKGKIKDIFLKIGMLPGTKKSVGSLVDITYRKATEQRLKQYHFVVENAHDSIFFKDLESRYIIANKKTLEAFGLSNKEVIGKDDMEIMTNKKEAKINIEDDQIVFKTGKPKEIIEHMTGADGKEYWFQAIKVPQFDDKGKVMGLIGIDRDITESKKAEEKIKKTMEANIYTMANIIEVKDPYTAGHQQRVSKLATTIAREMKLPEDKIEGISIASLIHDIGKISLPAEILSKPSKLNDVEYSLIRDHSKIGYDILKPIEFPYPIAKIILQHHERIHGSGYPNKLKGDKILLEARIIGVADVVEAMSSHRPYRPAWGIDKALEEISQKKGILYDPKVVDACIKLFKEKGFKF